MTGTGGDKQPPLKRTAKYETLPLNRGKRRALLDLTLVYTRVKDGFLRMLGRTVAWHHLDDPRGLRAATKGMRLDGVPAHLQDQALFDAVEALRRHIEAAVANTHLKAKLFARFEGVKRHYAFWILRRYARIGAALRGESPDPTPPPDSKWKGIAISVPERKEVVRFVRRILRRTLGRPPRVHLRRSFALDSTLYGTFEHNGRQYVSVATLTSRKRCNLPLRGRGRVSGNVRVVLHQERGTISVHVPYDVRVPAGAPPGPEIGLDAGVTEVLTTSTGEKLGPGYGTLLERLSEKTMETGKARNTLFQAAKKADERGDAAKASRIRRNNLGGKKLRVTRGRGEAAVKTMIGQAVRLSLRSRPAVVAVEDLSHLRGRTKSRKLSRIVSRWARSALRERLEFRTRAGCSRLETVNAAFTSQACPNPSCGFVHKDNRHGDRFRCLHCGRDGDADVVAATNLLARVHDPEIHRWTPVDAVKRILDGRFRRRKETGNHLGDPAGVGNGIPLPAGLQRRRSNPVPARDGTATEAAPNDPHGRSANNTEKPVQAFA